MSPCPWLLHWWRLRIDYCNCVLAGLPDTILASNSLSANIMWSCGRRPFTSWAAAWRTLCLKSRQYSGRKSSKDTVTVPPCAQSHSSPSTILLHWHAACCHWCPTTINSAWRIKTATTSFQDPSEIRRKGVICCCLLAWNQLTTEIKPMRSMPVFKCSLKMFLFQTA